ncbi:MAG: TonB-dependent receptor [Candidatus Neomarinimicrobiota bacterium]|nr:MAG: TonB-dependent receptor [Candidatus Neomarinimicrobiota bacterium]
MKRILSIVMVMVLPALVLAQGSISGTVTDAQTGAALAGANVFIEGTTMGAAADANGAYNIADVPNGTYTVTASVIGYADVSQTVTVEGATTLNFALTASALEMSALEVLASRATQATPVAFTDVPKEEMELRLASRDIPMVLNTTPSVYATQQGGGAGDARVNVRGFNQRNVAIMINGVPVNDMENGWVYWSNWDGVGDATSSIQVQRGLSAVNLATPSIGGTMNIITDPTAAKSGGLFKQEIGQWGFLKTTLNLNTGLINNKFALSGTFVKKTGDGFYGGTWTDAYAWYLGASYAMSKNDRFELYALGAPQRHGQNLYKQNMATYSHDFAKDYIPDSIKDAYFEKFPEVGRDFNQNWGKVSSSYDGKQYWAMYKEHPSDSRYDKTLLNERENFFHKPQVNLNWYHNFSDNMRLSSILYWSGGHGGGTGTYGHLYRRDNDGELGDDNYKFYYGPSPWHWDWDATIAANSSNDDTVYIDKKAIARGDKESVGILRNSRNNQWTVGAISKLNFDVSDHLQTIFGIDWRTAQIDHFREVRDLLGGDYYVFTGNDFDTTPESQKKHLGDKIVYYNTNTVDWLGLFGQANFESGPITAYGMAGWSTIKYTFTDHFTDAGNGKELFVESPSIGGFQVKGGASFNLSENMGVFANFGNVSKVPIFDNVIDDGNGALNDNPKNETFNSIELGGFMDMGMLNLKANYYNTTWKDRSFTKGVTNTDGSEGLVSLSGVNANHSGIEGEVAFQPMKLFRLDGAVSIGNWKYIDDAHGKYRPDRGVDTYEEYDLYIKDLKVGDQPQTQIALGASVFPLDGFQAQLVLKHYANNYADFDPLARTDPNDRAQSWKAPDYSVVDFHAMYNLPIQLGNARLQAFVHVFNLLDAVYIQDAVDNSKYNAYTGNGKNHAADDAEVFFGLPRFFNAGLTVRF